MAEKQLYPQHIVEEEKWMLIAIQNSHKNSAPSARETAVHRMLVGI